MPNWFRVSVRYGTAACVISCAGELDATNCERIAEAASRCLERGAAVIMIDCGAVTFIDGSGIDALVGIARSCRENGTGFTAVPSPRVRAAAEKLDAVEALGLNDRTVAFRRVPIDPTPLRPAETAF